jgi:DNA-binding transcriptional ArsR family regulator
VNAYQHAQLDAIGDPTRRAILARLLNGPLPVVELARDLPVSRPAVSQHLRVLKDAQLVTDRADGTRRVYALNPHAFASLRDYFDRFWTQALDAFKRRVEEDDRPSRTSAPKPRRTRTKEH